MQYLTDYYNGSIALYDDESRLISDYSVGGLARGVGHEDGGMASITSSPAIKAFRDAEGRVIRSASCPTQHYSLGATERGEIVTDLWVSDYHLYDAEERLITSVAIGNHAVAGKECWYGISILEYNAAAHTVLDTEGREIRRKPVGHNTRVCLQGERGWRYGAHAGTNAYLTDEEGRIIYTEPACLGEVGAANYWR